MSEQHEPARRGPFEQEAPGGRQSTEDPEALHAFEEQLPAGSTGEELGAGVGAPESSEPEAGVPEAGVPVSDAERLAKATAERDEYLDTLRRLQAEFDNYRKRMIRQQTELLDRATEGLLERLLPVLDALDLAVAHSATASGDEAAVVGRIASLLGDVVAKDGLQRIGEVGEAFDPTIHEAVAHEPAEPAEVVEQGPSGEPGASGEPAAPGEPAAGEAEAGPEPSGGPEQQAPGVPPVALVVEVLRPGYRTKGRVLRPAMVKVRG